jgi:hypothetical protein
VVRYGRFEVAAKPHKFRVAELKAVTILGVEFEREKSFAAAIRRIGNLPAPGLSAPQAVRCCIFQTSAGAWPRMQDSTLNAGHSSLPAHRIIAASWSRCYEVRNAFHANVIRVRRLKELKYR